MQKRSRIMARLSDFEIVKEQLDSTILYQPIYLPC